MNANPVKVKNYLAGQWHDLLDLIYPPVCGLCGQPADSDDRLVCTGCWLGIQGLEAPYCSTCREFLWTKKSCTDCDDQGMTVFSLGYFDDHLKVILHDLKYRGLKPLGLILGRKLAERITQFDNYSTRTLTSFDLILAVPLHHSRQYSRGFNQAEEIAGGIADDLGITTNFTLLRSTRKTKRQARLPASRREANVRNAYAVSDPDRLLDGKTVLLVDDVTTTGATLRENRRVLLEAGAKTVMAAVAGTAVSDL